MCICRLVDSNARCADIAEIVSLEPVAVPDAVELVGDSEPSPEATYSSPELSHVLALAYPVSGSVSAEVEEGELALKEDAVGFESLVD